MSLEVIEDKRYNLFSIIMIHFLLSFIRFLRLFFFLLFALLSFASDELKKRPKQICFRNRVDGWPERMNGFDK